MSYPKSYTLDGAADMIDHGDMNDVVVAEVLAENTLMYQPFRRDELPTGLTYHDENGRNMVMPILSLDVADLNYAGMLFVDNFEYNPELTEMNSGLGSADNPRPAYWLADNQKFTEPRWVLAAIMNAIFSYIVSNGKLAAGPDLSDK